MMSTKRLRQESHQKPIRQKRLEVLAICLYEIRLKDNLPTAAVFLLYGGSFFESPEVLAYLTHKMKVSPDAPL